MHRPRDDTAVTLAARHVRAHTREHAAEFGDFYTSGFTSVYRAALAFTNSPEIAADATQEGFARAFARWRRLRDQTWALGWVMTTALNAARKLQRESRRRAPGDSRSPAPADEQTIARVDLVASLAVLPARQKQALVLHYIGGFRVEEVAELMGISTGGVKSNLFKGRQALMTDKEPT